MSKFSNFKQVGQGLFGIEAFGGSGAESEFGCLVSSIDISWSSDKAEIKNQKGNIKGKAYYNSQATLSFEMYALDKSNSLPRIGQVYNLTCAVPNLTIKGADNETGDANITKCIIESVNVKMSAEAYVTLSITASYCEDIDELHTTAS